MKGGDFNRGGQFFCITDKLLEGIFVTARFRVGKSGRIREENGLAVKNSYHGTLSFRRTRRRADESTDK